MKRTASAADASKEEEEDLPVVDWVAKLKEAERVRDSSDWPPEREKGPREWGGGFHAGGKPIPKRKKWRCDIRKSGITVHSLLFEYKDDAEDWLKDTSRMLGITKNQYRILMDARSVEMQLDDDDKTSTFFDVDDLHIVLKYKWKLKEGHVVSTNGFKMERIVSKDPRRRIRHIDGNTMNNRKKNLQVIAPIRKRTSRKK